MKSDGGVSRVDVSVVRNIWLHRDSGISLSEKIKSWNNVSCLQVSDGSVVELDQNSVHFARKVLLAREMSVCPFLCLGIGCRERVKKGAKNDVEPRRQRDTVGYK